MFDEDEQKYRGRYQRCTKIPAVRLSAGKKINHEPEQAASGLQTAVLYWRKRRDDERYFHVRSDNYRRRECTTPGGRTARSADDEKRPMRACALVTCTPRGRSMWFGKCLPAALEKWASDRQHPPVPSARLAATYNNQAVAVRQRLANRASDPVRHPVTRWRFKRTAKAYVHKR